MALCTLCITGGLHTSTYVYGATDTTHQSFEQGSVVEILEQYEYVVEELSQKQIVQELRVEITSGVEKGKIVTVRVGGEHYSNINSYAIGDNVVISISEDADGNTVYTISDYSRTGPLIVLGLLFVAIVIIVGKVHGIRSLIGLALSLVIVFGFIIPNIIEGHNPIIVSTIAGSFLIPATFYITHGFKRSITIAIIGSLISLICTGLLATYSIVSTHITGMGIEDVFFLQTIGSQPIHLGNLIIAGIIISAIGILDDVTVSQVSVVEQLHKAHGNASTRTLYHEAMTVGQNHISSMVNTLVLVYAGASIPILLIFSSSLFPTAYLINLEFVALEIVRTLVTSIGLILAIPLTTYLAAVSAANKGT